MRWVVVVIAMLSLLGCGHKGQLYLPTNQFQSTLFK